MKLSALIICHGQLDLRRIHWWQKFPTKIWEDADYMDISDVCLPDYKIDIRQKIRRTDLIAKYDLIVSVSCPFDVYILSNSGKARPQFWRSICLMLKPKGRFVTQVAPVVTSSYQTLRALNIKLPTFWIDFFIHVAWVPNLLYYLHSRNKLNALLELQPRIVSRLLKNHTSPPNTSISVPQSEKVRLMKLACKQSPEYAILNPWLCNKGVLKKPPDVRVTPILHLLQDDIYKLTKGCLVPEQQSSGNILSFVKVGLSSK